MINRQEYENDLKKEIHTTQSRLKHYEPTGDEYVDGYTREGLKSCIDKNKKSLEDTVYHPVWLPVATLQRMKVIGGYIRFNWDNLMMLSFKYLTSIVLKKQEVSQLLLDFLSKAAQEELEYSRSEETDLSPRQMRPYSTEVFLAHTQEETLRELQAHGIEDLSIAIAVGAKLLSDKLTAAQCDDSVEFFKTKTDQLIYSILVLEASQRVAALKITKPMFRKPELADKWLEDTIAQLGDHPRRDEAIAELRDINKRMKP
jgi:hypothetical protein